LRRVVHLHRRAGFAATWGEVQRDLQDGPKASIDRLLKGNCRSEGVPKDFEETAGLLFAAATEAGRLKAWWVYRMLFGPDPLTERLALVWHNHFATSADKGKTGSLTLAVRQQNKIFRTWARAPFRELLRRVVHDPALLLWLDAPANRKGQPNENLARELMELFTLGIGHYTEADVKEAARALTGWTVNKDGFREDRSLHDDGEKTILKRTGKWGGDDLVQMLLEHPATAERLAGRIGEFLLGEKAVEPPGLRALAAGLREHRLDVGWAVETVLRSRAFFAETNLGNRVLGPVEFVVGAARALETFRQPPSTLLLADTAARLGQDLFHPPNVGGWPGGRQWISPPTMIGRANFAAALVKGSLAKQRQPLDALGLAQNHGHGGNLDAVLNFYGELLTGFPPGPAWRRRLLTSLGPKATANPEAVRRAVILMLASPEAQLA
jgi:uncharacterized protein (DUF1800 family)